MNIKIKRGGWRPNAGRKKKYDEDTEMTCFRLPISHKKKIKKIVSEYLKTIEINRNDGNTTK